MYKYINFLFNRNFDQLLKNCQMNTRFLHIIIIIFLTITTYGQENPDNLFLRDRLVPITGDNIFKTEGYYNWGASIVKGKDGKYHMFYARWKKEYKFTGWLTHSEIAHAVSKTPYGPWKIKGTVIKGRGMGHWDAITAHNPKIKYFDGKYYLYYISRLSYPEVASIVFDHIVPEIAHYISRQEIENWSGFVYPW